MQMSAAILLERDSGARAILCRARSLLAIRTVGEQAVREAHEAAVREPDTTLASLVEQEAARIQQALDTLGLEFEERNETGECPQGAHQVSVTRSSRSREGKDMP